MIIIYSLCKYNKLRTLLASLALQQVKEVSTVVTKKEDYTCKCHISVLYNFSFKHSNIRD